MRSALDERISRSIHPQHFSSRLSSMQHVSPSRTSTKPHREKDGAPIPTDLAERMIAHKRKQAKYVYSPVSPLPLQFTSLIVLLVLVQRQSQGPHRTSRCFCERPFVTASPAPAHFRAVSSCGAYNSQDRARLERILSSPETFPDSKVPPSPRARPQTTGQAL
jgi:hypothetical protein